MAAMTQQEIADRIEIDDLLTRYATAIDTKNWALLATCFTPDAFIDYTSAGGIRGRFPEVAQWLAQVLDMFPMTQHLVTNRAVVIVDRDAATSRSAFFNPMGLSADDDGFVLFFEGGYYNDTLVRTAEGWRIAERIEESCYSTRLQPVLLKVFGD
jgi:3-phenylpropionate/cinnamic acid dioxygenase small subunit